MKKLLLGLVVLIQSMTGHAQSDTTQSERHPYFGLTFGLSGMKVKDNLVMPVRYAGSNLDFGFRYRKMKPKSLQELDMEFVIGGIKTKEANIDNFGARYLEPRAALYYTDISYVWMHSVPQLSSEKYRVFMGASAFLLVNVRYSERWDNSLLNYDGAISPLAFQGSIERDIKIKKKTNTVSFKINFPVLVYIMRPEFSGVPDFLDHETDFISSLTSTSNSNWTGVWNFPRIKTQLELDRPLGLQNFIKLTYKWEYYSYQDPLKIQFGGHSFMFTLYTHL